MIKTVVPNYDARLPSAIIPNARPKHRQTGGDVIVPDIGRSDVNVGSPSTSSLRPIPSLSAPTASTFSLKSLVRACLQLGGVCARTDQNQTRNIVL